MKVKLSTTQAKIIQELLVANAINAQRTDDVVDLMAKCQEIIEETDDAED